MFFRRAKPHLDTFSERMEKLKQAGLAVESLPGGKARVTRGTIGAVVEDVPGGLPRVSKAGLIMGDEIGVLVNEGYQVFWRTPSGKTRPALSTQLHALHEFEEDLKEGLGLTSLYNQGLGTTSDLHLYDRVEHRDAGDTPKPWARKPA
jgi:hypothetical protein